MAECQDTMAASLATAIEILLPIFGLILLGYALRWRSFVADSFWAPAGKLAYFLLLPALLINTLATAPLRDLQIGSLAAVLALGLLSVAGILLVLRPRIGADGRAFSSVFQGAIRHNTYVGLATVAVVASATGTAYAAVALPVMVILVNLLSVGVLVRYAAAVRVGWAAVLRAIATNPLILACVLGVLLNLSGIGLPAIPGRMVAALGQASLPLGLLLVGAGLDLRSLHRRPQLMAVASAAKLMLLPAIVYGLALLLHLEGTGAMVAVIFAALPTAPSAYILAEQMGGDAPLMAAILTLETLLAIATLPFWLAWVAAV